MRRKIWKCFWTSPCPARKCRVSQALRKLKRKPQHPSRSEKTNYDCMVEAHESTRRKLEPSLPKSHEDHIADKAQNSTVQFYVSHKFTPMPQEMKIPDSKTAGSKEWKKIETIPAWQLNKVKSKKELILDSQRDKKKSTSLHWWTHVILKKCGVGIKKSEVQRSSRTSRRHCKRRFWRPCSIHWTRLICITSDCRKSKGCHCKATRFWWTSSWCSICIHSGKVGGCSKIDQNSNIRMSRYMDTSSAA